MGTPTDPAVIDHLDRARADFTDAGAIDFVRHTVRATWASNRARHSREIHFDDNRTLGLHTSLNVSNRLAATIETVEAPPLVHLVDRNGVVELTLHERKMRVIKAPGRCSLDPDMDDDFTWRKGSSRRAAAERNAREYRGQPREGMLALEFGATDEDAEHGVHRCCDYFVVWAGDSSSDDTRGWLGLPTSGDRPWLGVLPLWDDTLE